MNAGKTSALLQLNYNYNELGMKTMLFTSALDTRYGTDIIQSRIGLKHAARVYDANTDFNNEISPKNAQGRRDLPNVSCVFVDEAQFLSRQQVFDLAIISDKFKPYGTRRLLFVVMVCAQILKASYLKAVNICFQ